MGASAWSYVVPFRPDVDRALQELRQKVFEEGDYYKPAKWYRELYARGIIDERRLNDKLKELESEPEPKTIEELIRLRDHQGTHTIIDIDKVLSVPEFRCISPLTPQELIEILGTDKPTYEMVKLKMVELQGLRDRWQGIYVVIYKNELPDMILFAGFSGD